MLFVCFVTAITFYLLLGKKKKVVFIFRAISDFFLNASYIFLRFLLPADLCNTNGESLIPTSQFTKIKLITPPAVICQLE